jgi:hypothetical protein
LQTSQHFLDPSLLIRFSLLEAVRLNRAQIHFSHLLFAIITHAHSHPAPTLIMHHRKSVYCLSIIIAHTVDLIALESQILIRLQDTKTVGFLSVQVRCGALAQISREFDSLSLAMASLTAVVCSSVLRVWSMKTVGAVIPTLAAEGLSSMTAETMS